jgi:transcriptional regulator with XRE-family HTH domain
VGTRLRQVDLGAARSRDIIASLGREVRGARVDRGLSQEQLGRTVGLSGSEVGRIERGLIRGVTIEQMCLLLAALGLELSARAFPAGQPIRDAAHAALLGRFRSRLHRSLAWRIEVPLPIPGDRRAWDAVVRGDSWVLGVEAETRPRDLQALQRRLALKARDGGVDAVVLLLRDTRHNRGLVRESADLAAAYPVPGRRVIELLGAGTAPPGDGIVLL